MVEIGFKYKQPGTRVCAPDCCVLHTVWVSRTAITNYHKLSGLKQIYSLTVLEVASLNSGHGQGYAPSEDSWGRILPYLFLASDSSWRFLVFLGL